jgi:glycosyltransferase involved in cell wall biosynthesis
MIAPPWFPVPPPAYGGTERVCALVAEALVDRGHDVTVFASGDSAPSGRLRATIPQHDPTRLREIDLEAEHLSAALHEIDRFDVIHDNSSVFGPLLFAREDTPAIHTVHGELTASCRAAYQTVDHRVGLIALTRPHADQAPELLWHDIIPNPVNPAEIEFRPWKDDYVIFLGRLSPEKAPHLAIEAAGRAGIEIFVAGPVHQRDRDYFEQSVRPLLVRDGVHYIESTGGREKANLLAGARAMLCPVCWPEPFGLVAIEAMACGTPVIAYPNGALTETVLDGETGFLVDDLDAMSDAIDASTEIDPFVCRNHVEEHYSPQRVGRRYEQALARAYAGAAR